MFVRKKKTASGTYHYLVENRREGGKVRQVVLCYLGGFPSVEAALAGLPVLVRQHIEKVLQAQSRVERVLQWWETGPGSYCPGSEPPKPDARRFRRWNRQLHDYWCGKQDVESYTRMVNECTARLECLRVTLGERSAQKCRVVSAVLDTTPSP